MKTSSEKRYENEALSSWVKAMRAYDIEESNWQPVWHGLTELYDDSKRHYHNMGHVCFVIRMTYTFIVNKPIAGSWISDAYTFAAFFHDAIYDTTRDDNEERSAEYAGSVLEELYLPEELIQLTEDMIVSTKKHIPVKENDNIGNFLDCDLSILGSSTSAYDNYRNAIRKEYSWVPEAEYNKKRASLLKKMLMRENLFYSDKLRSMFEFQARKNLVREIRMLKS